MRAFKIDTWRFPILMRLKPAPCTKTPAIASLQPWETELGSFCYQVVSLPKGILQKLICQAGADRMWAMVLRPRVATAITITACYQVLSAWLEGLAENIFWIIHDRILHSTVNYCMKDRENWQVFWQIDYQPGEAWFLCTLAFTSTPQKYLRVLLNAVVSLFSINI